MEINDLEPLKFPTENDDIRAFTVLRGIVNAQNLYSENNLCDYTGDDGSHVAACRAGLCSLLEIDTECLVMPRQTHTARVAVIHEAFMALDAKAKREYLQDIDAMVTSMSGVAIGVNTADCLPIVLRDATTGIIGVAHAGWKGTVAGIAKNTVKAMEELGAGATRIEASVGASICQECFEVGDEVVAKFGEKGFPITQICKRNENTKKAHIDLWQANAWLLEQSGLSSENILLSGNCTRCNPDRYFSARRLGLNSGRTFTFVMRKQLNTL